MPVVRKSGQAREDLTELWHYLYENAGESVADAALRDIETVGALLGEYPHLGRNRDEITKGVRSFAKKNYVIFYREDNSAIEVLRVLHGARDITRQFEA